MAYFTEPSDFPFKHVNQADVPDISADDMKTYLDSQAKALRDYLINTHLPEIEMVLGYMQGNEVTMQIAINDFIAHKADETQHVPYAVDTGVANAYVVTLNPAPMAYVDGMAVCVKIKHTSTGASTLNVNGLGAKTIKDAFGNAITANGLVINIPYTFRYEATSGNFILLSKGSGANKVGSATVITPSTTDQAIPQGYYGGATGDGKVLGDADLVAENIKSGVNIFGVDGTLPDGTGMKRYASGSGTSDGSKHCIVSGLAFTPSIVIVHQAGITYYLDYATSTTQAYGNNGSVYTYTMSSGFNLTSKNASTGFTWQAWE